MSFELILNSVARHISLTEQESQHFCKLLSARTIRKKQFFLRENEICKHSVFVNSGCLRGYNIDQNGFEHILQFAPAGWWIADMYSLISQKPGNLNIDALEDTEVLLLSRTDQEQLLNDIPKFERFFRIILENSLVSSRQRVLDSMSLTAQERYDNFCKKYPTLIETLPQKQVAAYIGVTPEFLSKMRAQMMKSGKSA